MIRRGEVRVNGKRSKVSEKLNEGDRIRIPPVHLTETSDPVIPPAILDRIRESVLHEDDRFLVLNKPCGLAVHMGGSEEFGLIEVARKVWDHRPLELAHRIDRDTSGCVVIAKTRVALLEMHYALNNDKVSKQYDAIVSKRWPRACIYIDLPLQKFNLPNGERRVEVNANGKEALTLFEIVRENDSATWLRVEPKTGRTHQIRVHCKHQGHPIVGDSKYGTTKNKRMLLHATRVCLLDAFDVTAQLDSAFEEYWAKASITD